MQTAIDGSRSPAYMERYLNRPGYIADLTGAHRKIRLPQRRFSADASQNSLTSRDDGYRRQRRISLEAPVAAADGA